MLFNKLKKYLSEYTPKEKRFILGVLLAVFFIAQEYAIIRPASTSILLSNYSSKIFPYCWILGVPVNLLIVYLYNKFLPTLGCLKTFVIFAVSIICVNVATSLYINKYPVISLLQFLFKDVYILLAFKQTWSMIHATINKKKSKILYGLMFGVGGLGSVIGGMVSGFFAVSLKSYNLFLFSAPLYIIVLFLYKFALKNSNVDKENFKTLMFNSTKDAKDGLSYFKKSNFLFLILFLVIFMQVSTAFLDYQYNVFLEKTIPNIDLRTSFAGKVTSVINAITTCFQFLGGFVVIQLLGLKRAHLMVPVLLGINSIGLLLAPSFGMATYSFITIKSLDYSFFGIIREMLYVPLKMDEKYRAKAIIDVFAYRSAKAFAALFLIFMQNIKGLNIILFISIISMLIYFIWARMVVVMFKKHEAITTQD